MASTMTKSCLGLRARAGLRPLPFTSRLSSLRVRAESTSAPEIKWTTDSETIRDVFAFGGSAPERVNGRVAMMGFVSILGPELSKKQPVLEQVGDNWFWIILFSLTITMASLMPKFISGTSLKELLAAATSENMKGDLPLLQALSLFDTNLELWSGRLAMLGFAGLIAIELAKGGESVF